MENVSSVPEMANIDSSASGGEGKVSAPQMDNSASESKLQGENDPNESFSAWLERQNKSKEKKDDKPGSTDGSSEKVAKKTGTEDKKEVQDPKNVKSEDKDPVKTSKQEEKEVVNEAKTESEIKVGEKSYKATDIEKLLQDSESLRNNETKVTRQLQDLVKVLKENPGAVLDRLEVPRETLEKYYYEKYLEFDSLTPEQKVEKLQAKEQARVEAEKKAQEEAAQKEQYEANRKYWTGVIKESLANEGLPETEWTVQRMAGYIKQSRDKGLSATNQELAKLVKEDMLNAQKAALQGLKPEQLREVLGEEAVKALRQAEVDRLKQAKLENKAQPQTTSDKPKKPSKRFTNVYDMMD